MFTTVTRRLLRRFTGDAGGNVAIIFAVALVPMIALAGAAVEYSSISNARAKLQAAADAAALAATRSYGKSWADRQRIATDTFESNLQPSGGAHDIQFDIVDRGQSHRVEASAKIETTIMGLMGIHQISTSVAAEAISPKASLEVVLVLDNTGSMSSQSKIGILREATRNFLDMMETAAAIPGKTIKIGLVPFTTTVRLDANTYRNASWINHGSKKAADWRGCLYDRQKPNDTSDAAPTTTDKKTLFEGDPSKAYSSSGCGMARIHELSNNFTSLRTRVGEMNASGNTNVALGVIWGLHLLSQSMPFPQGAPWSDKETTKVMIVLTDGENTESRHSKSTKTIDTATESACNAVKANDVLIYTVRVVNGNASLLRDCATDSWMFTDIKKASDLNATFEKLAADIINRHLRLTM